MNSTTWERDGNQVLENKLLSLLNYIILVENFVSKIIPLRTSFPTQHKFNVYFLQQREFYLPATKKNKEWVFPRL